MGSAIRFFGVVVSNLAESVLASGLPMREGDFGDWDKDVSDLEAWMLGNGNGLDEGRRDWCERQVRRAIALGGCEGGESHDCYLCGIGVSFCVTAPRYWYPEMQRYHFAEIVSSTSTMHKLRSVCGKVLAGEMDWRECFAEGASESAVMCALGEMGKVMADDGISDNDKVRLVKGLLPESYLQTCRVSTNYRQLKTWVRQRSTHRLAEWREACQWARSLPWFGELCGCGKKN